MGHRCYIAFKKEDEVYKKYIQDEMGIEIIDHSLHDAIETRIEEYSLKKIKEEFLATSTVTIYLIGIRSNENLGWEEQKYIKKELQASLYQAPESAQNGILGVVLPTMYNLIDGGAYLCKECGKYHNMEYINDRTVVKEFSYNYAIPNNKCSWNEEDRFCVLVRWADFENEPEKYIEQAFNKTSQPIAEKTLTSNL